jgi:hypothetical protein
LKAGLADFASGLPVDEVGLPLDTSGAKPVLAGGPRFGRNPRLARQPRGFASNPRRFQALSAVFGPQPRLEAVNPATIGKSGHGQKQRRQHEFHRKIPFNVYTAGLGFGYGKSQLSSRRS